MWKSYLQRVKALIMAILGYVLLGVIRVWIWAMKMGKTENDKSPVTPGTVPAAKEDVPGEGNRG